VHCRKPVHDRRRQRLAELAAALRVGEVSAERKDDRDELMPGLKLLVVTLNQPVMKRRLEPGNGYKRGPDGLYSLSLMGTSIFHSESSVMTPSS
jgi:hypothetical protein